MYKVHIDLKTSIKGSNVLHAVFLEHRLWVYRTGDENSFYVEKNTAFSFVYSNCS